MRPIVELIAARYFSNNQLVDIGIGTNGANIINEHTIVRVIPVNTDLI